MAEIALGFRPDTRRVYDAPLLRGVDGDTVNIDQSVRMVSIDTPESHFGGSAPTAQATLDRARQRLEAGDYEAIGQRLRDYLIARLTPDAAQRHLGAGARAGAECAKFRAEQLVIDPVSGVGKVGVLVTGEVIEENGRLLAYVTPWLNRPLPPPEDPKRRTFNLQLVETGWAVLFLIYPSLPRDADLRRAVHAAQAAWDNKLGAWDEFGEDLLLGYEYRACIKLGEPDKPDKPGELPVAPQGRVDAAFRRVCVDLRTREIAGRFGYHRIEPPYRLWFWQDDLATAREIFQLVDP